MSALRPRRLSGRRAWKTAAAVGVALVATLAATQAQPASAATPTVNITSQPPATTTSTSATFVFTTSRAKRVDCSLDGAGFASCNSPKTYSGLAVGKHTFVVRAKKDAVSVTATATWEVVATAAPPPPPPPPASFSVSSSIAEGSTLAGAVTWQATPSKTVGKVDFYVDGALRWTEHVSPYIFNGDGNKLDTTTLPDGTHTLKAVATAADGSSASVSANILVSNTAAAPPSTQPPPPSTQPPPSGTASTGGAGEVRFMEATSSATDSYTNSPSTTQQQWMRDHWSRAIVYSTYWDSRTSWYPNGWGYLNAYAIYRTSSLATQHPDWILKDAAGSKLFIPWGCSGGVCPQYAADIGNPAWQQYFISQAQRLAAVGYKGIFVDDVDMDRNVGNGSGSQVAPIDPRTGAEMSDAAWKSYFASFLEAVRAAVPGLEIVHNSVWFAGGGAHDASNPSIVRQVKAASLINIERGFNDGGLTGGTGSWSVYALMRYIDNVHAYGAHVILQSYAGDKTAAEYNLAGYFLVSDGEDLVSTSVGSLPDQWWSGYDTNLGDAKGARYSWNGVWRRDFTGGFVLLNEPGAPTKTLSLGTAAKTTSGATVTSVTLGPGQGAVLRT